MVLKASARIATKRRSLSVRRTGNFFDEIHRDRKRVARAISRKHAPARDHIKNLPVGQMEILMVDSREGTRYSHLHVRRAPRFQVEGLETSLYPKMHSYLDPEVGVNLRFQGSREPETAAQENGGVVPREASGQ